MRSPEDQDRADMAALVDRRDAALNDLMSRHAEPLFRYLIRLVHDESEAADLTQETFVRIYQHRAESLRGSKFSTWLYTIARNLARDRFRHMRRRPQVSRDDEN